LARDSRSGLIDNELVVALLRIEPAGAGVPEVSARLTYRVLHVGAGGLAE